MSPGKAPERCPSRGLCTCSCSFPASSRGFAKSRPAWREPTASLLIGTEAGPAPAAASVVSLPPGLKTKWTRTRSTGLGAGEFTWKLGESLGSATDPGEAGGWEERSRAESCVPLVCNLPELAATPAAATVPTTAHASVGAKCRAPPPSWRRLGVLGKITPAFPFPEGPEHLKREGTRRHLESSHGGGAPSFRTAGVHGSDAGNASSAWLSGAHPRRSQRRGAVCPPPLGQPASHASHEPPGRWTKTTSKCLSGLHSGQNRTASTWFPL